MKSLILKIIHEDKLSEENLLSITGGASEEKKSEESSNSKCGDSQYCYVNINCPILECIKNGGTK